jgi:hypothetical protein
VFVLQAPASRIRSRTLSRGAFEEYSAASSVLSPVNIGAQTPYMTGQCSWQLKKKTLARTGPVLAQPRVPRVLLGSWLLGSGSWQRLEHEQLPRGRTASLSRTSTTPTCRGEDGGPFPSNCAARSLIRGERGQPGLPEQLGQSPMWPPHQLGTAGIIPVVFIHCPYSNPHPPQMGRVWVENNYPLKKWGG